MTKPIFFLFATLFLYSCKKDQKETPPQNFPASISKSIEHQGKQRKYLLHIPVAYNGITEVPLLIILHGGGGTIQTVQGFTQMNTVSDQNGFITVYPEGFGITSAGYSWADGRGTSADALGIDDVGFIEKMIVQITSEFKIKPTQIYICGFSNGGFMTQKFACESNTRFAAMGSLGSSISQDLINTCNPARKIPFIFIFGSADPFVPLNGGTVAGNTTPVVGINTLVSFWKNINKCQSILPSVLLQDIDNTDSSTVSLFQFRNCSCNSNINFYLINNGGHTWPGVKNAGYEVIAGKTNGDMSASQVLWDFFKQHQLCL